MAEVHGVDGRLALTYGQLDRGLESRLHKLEGQGHGARRVEHKVNVAVGLSLQHAFDGGHITKGGAHQQELRVRQGKEGHLPCPAAVVVAKVMELVHRHAGHVAVFALAQRLVCQDLCRAADDGRIGVDGGVSSDHAHVVAAQDVHQVKELLADQRLDGRRVEGTPTAAHGHEAEPQRHHRLARSRGRA